MLTPRQILGVVEIVIYVPVLIIATFLCFKHGLRKSLSSMSMVVLALLRIIGGSTGIEAVNKPSDTSLLTCSLVCSFIGLSPLLQTVIAFVRRVQKNSTKAIIPGKILHLLGVVVLVALILGILAGTKLFSSNPSTVADGHKFSKASAILYLATFIALVAAITVTVATRSRTAPSDYKLLWASVIVIPFILVRIVYQLCIAFDDSNTNTFSLFTDATHPVLVEGLMSLMPEYLTVIIYIVAALLTPKDATPMQGSYDDSTRRSRRHSGRRSANRVNGYDASPRQEAAYDSPQQEGYGSPKQQQQQRQSPMSSLGGGVRGIIRNGPIRSAVRGAMR